MVEVKKPKILIIINRLVIGGQAIDTIPLAWYLQENFTVHVLYGEKEQDEEEALYLLDLYPGLHIQKLPLLQRSISPMQDWKAYRAIKKIIKENGYAIVHTHGFKSGMLGRRAAFTLHVPCIVHTFHGHLFHSYYNRFISKCIIRLERWLGKMTDIIVTISKEQKQEISEVFRIVPADKNHIVHLGIDEKHFFRHTDAGGNSFKEKFQVDEKQINIGIIGRIVQIKNFTLFVEVVEKMEQLYSQQVRFFVVGDGVLAGEVQELLKAKNISFSTAEEMDTTAPVVFTSWMPDIAAVIQAIDIVVLTSYNEGTPMSLIEAQLCGKPVVATNVGGVAATFLPDASGYLVAPGDAAAFAEKLAILIENKNKRLDMGKIAVNFAAANFSKKREVEEMTKLYQACLEQKQQIS